jgi:hypothetical protein
MRGLIVLVLVIGVCLGWIIRLARNAQMQRDAVAAITRARGSVTYDFQAKHNRYSSFNESPWPRWLVKLLGVDYFGNVVSVVIPGVSEEELIHIGNLSRLRVLYLIGPAMTDSGLPQLKGLTKLTELHVIDSPITDAGLANLKGLTKLQSIGLLDTQVSTLAVQDLQAALPKSQIQYGRTSRPTSE